MSEFDHIQDSVISRIPQYKTVTVLSWHLLAWILKMDRIRHFFTNFITSPELFGSLYISGNLSYPSYRIFTARSQFGIYAITLGGLFSSSIIHFPNRYSVRPSRFNLNNRSLIPNWSFREHLSRSLPTEMIFYLLRSIRSECITLGFSGELKLDTLEIIIKWLQVSDSECDRQTPQTKNPICD